MHKTIILILLTSTLTNQTMCMKRKLTPTTEQQAKKAKLEEEVVLHPFPFELQTKIYIDHLPDVIPTTDFKKTCKEINTLTLVNKQWNGYINDPHIIRTIINMINNQLFPYGIINQHITAQTISTRGTKNYIQQNNSLYHKIVRKKTLLPFSIQELVTAGADVNFVHPKGHFLYLASTRNYAYTKQLLELNANLDATNNSEPILSLAIKNNSFDIVHLLLKYNPKDKCPKTVIEHGTPDMIESFLSHARLTHDELRELNNCVVLIDPNSTSIAKFIIDRYIKNNPQN